MADYYAATNGTPGGSGTIGSPWDLQTALSNGSQTSGDTLWLRGGTYYGRFHSTLTGGTVRSYTGEWAVIDGYQIADLASGIDDNDTFIDLAAPMNVGAADSVFIESEGVSIIDVVSLTRLEIQRYPGATSHSAGADVWAGTATLQIDGSDTLYRDFEVKDSNPTREFPGGTNPSTVRGGAGFHIYGENTKFINLVVHDTNDGLYVSAQADGAEAYGCIVYNNGHTDPTRGHGHGFYIQGLSSGSKLFRKNISFNNYATGMKAFGEAGFANNITFDKIVAFNNGSPASYPGNPQGDATNFRMIGVFIGTAVEPVVGSSITNCLCYQEPDASGNNIGVGYVSTGGSNFTMTDNYLAGGSTGIGVSGLSGGTITGNTVIAGNAYGKGSASATVPSTGGFTWNNNSYRNLTSVANPDYEFLLTINGVAYLNPLGGGYLKFTDTPNEVGGGWKEGSGWDGSSSYSTSAPTGQFVTVLPNEYEIGRATIVAYNWDLSSTVPVDLSLTGLSDGQDYEIRNMQNYFAAAVATGTYNAASPTINLTTAGLTVAMPIGSPDDFTPASVAPEFCVYELLPGAADASAPGQPTNFTVTPTRRNGTTGTIEIAWTLADETETSVVLTRVLNGTPTEIVLGADVESYTDTGLTIGATYTYYVRAENAAGGSESTDPIIRVMTGLTSFGAPPSISN